MHAVVTGATGMIGRRLVASLGGDVTVLSRDVTSARHVTGAVRYAQWDGQSPISPAVFEGADVVYHLAGEPISSGRWTQEKKRRILESRWLGTRAVVDAIASTRQRLSLVSASAIGYYGSRGEEILTEESRAGDGFLADVCRKWEDEAARLERFGGRVAMLRIGIVLAREGGALARLIRLFRAGLGGRLGQGDQWMSWIHVSDLVALLRRAGENDDLAGPVNAVAPAPVRNSEFTKVLANALHRPAFAAAPGFALRVALGELADVVLASQRVLPLKATDGGFLFRHPDLDAALADLIGPTAGRAIEART